MGKMKQKAIEEKIKSLDVVKARGHLVKRVNEEMVELPIFQLYHLLIVIKKMKEE